MMITLARALLILMWSYAALSKLLNYGYSRQQMLDQVFPTALALRLTWLIPVVELALVGLLLFERSRPAGFLLSSLLLLMFSGYILLIGSGYFGRIPCSCGGIISEMSWSGHLAFNFFFLLLSVGGLVMHRKDQA